MSAEPQPQGSEREEPKPQESNILEVDLKPKDNNTEHHTNELSIEKLVVRRGKSFDIRLKLKDPYDPKVHNFTFTVSTGVCPDENRGTKSVFGIPDTVKRSAEAKAVWKAEFSQKESTDPDKKGCDQEKKESEKKKKKCDKEKKECKKEKKERDKEKKESDPEKKESDPEEGSVDITITPPAHAPVGIYLLSLNCSGEDKQLGVLALLFNPWCPDDTVYMDKKNQIKEYVMNEHGILFRGSGNYIFPMDWDFGQFEEDMVEIAIGLLHVSPEHLENPGENEAWCDPVYVGRVISAMINSEGDHGVLKGNWSGKYPDGKAPTHWCGSHPILKHWLDSGCKPVKYGQCWVFAAVMCSVMRTLGIPCRVVTNFSSAHDCNKNLTIDMYHADYGVSQIDSPDSVWNFHVWLEAWMTRPDLPQGNDGWQVLDPTPQELSGGVFCCGPAPVKAILSGKVDLKYDCPFVFAEVNADCIDWLVKGDGTHIKLWADKKRVGQNISTKCIGNNKRKDITSRYKHKEGSEKERTVFKYAMSHDYSEQGGDLDSEESGDEEEGAEVNATTTTEEPAAELPKVSLKFEEVSELVSGQDVKLNLVLHSEATEPRPLSINISIIAKTYNGSAHSDIQCEHKEDTLQPGQDLCIPVVVPFSKYWEPMAHNDVMKISAVVSDTGDDSEIYLAESDVVLQDPPVEVKVLNEAYVHQRVYLEVCFRNPVCETLKACTLTLSGCGLFKDEFDVSLPDLGPQRKVRVKLLFFPYKCGQKTLVADFNCSVFRDIKKSLCFDVK